MVGSACKHWTMPRFSTCWTCMATIQLLASSLTKAWRFVTLPCKWFPSTNPGTSLLTVYLAFGLNCHVASPHVYPITLQVVQAHLHTMIQTVVCLSCGIGNPSGPVNGSSSVSVECGYCAIWASFPVTVETLGVELLNKLNFLSWPKMDCAFFLHLDLTIQDAKQSFGFHLS